MCYGIWKLKLTVKNAFVAYCGHYWECSPCKILFSDIETWSWGLSISMWFSFMTSMDCRDSLPADAADDGRGWDGVGNGNGRGNCRGTRAFVCRFVRSWNSTSDEDDAVLIGMFWKARHWRLMHEVIVFIDTEMNVTNQGKEYIFATFCMIINTVSWSKNVYSACTYPSADTSS